MARNVASECGDNAVSSLLEDLLSNAIATAAAVDDTDYDEISSQSSRSSSRDRG